MQRAFFPGELRALLAPAAASPRAEQGQWPLEPVPAGFLGTAALTCQIQDLALFHFFHKLIQVPLNENGE